MVGDFPSRLLRIGGVTSFARTVCCTPEFPRTGPALRPHELYVSLEVARAFILEMRGELDDLAACRLVGDEYVEDLTVTESGDKWSALGPRDRWALRCDNAQPGHRVTAAPVEAHEASLALG